MTTNELEGRALHEAAARAMGFTIAHGSVYGGEKWRGDVKAERCVDCGCVSSGWPTEREMMAWLHERRDCIILGCYVGKVSACAASAVASNIHAEGRDLREALARLVVAVKEREAKQA